MESHYPTRRGFQAQGNFNDARGKKLPALVEGREFVSIIYTSNSAIISSTNS